MIRYLLPLIALPLAFAAVASATAPIQRGALNFDLAERGGSGRVTAHFFSAREDKHFWNADFGTTEFDGLDVAGFHAGGTRPVRFSLVRQSGRLDCSGSGGSGRASGSCDFAAQPAFAAALAAAKVAEPVGEDWLSLFASM
ncbi:MAG: hypothetical protein ABIO29_08300 [Sphingomicrobium sp.]